MFFRAAAIRRLDTAGMSEVCMIFLTSSCWFTKKTPWQFIRRREYIKEKYTRTCFVMQPVSWEECVASYTRNERDKSAVPTDAKHGKTQLNLKTTEYNPFKSKDEAAFKEGYMCAKEIACNSFCGHCGMKNKFILPDYTSRKSALDLSASRKSNTTPATQALNFNGYDGKPLSKSRSPRLIRQ